MPTDLHVRRRLDSWKEIAAHLGRNERTAIRWEKKGLPVHRVPGGQRQAVFAYTDEIDAWLLGQQAISSSSDPLTLTTNTQSDDSAQSDGVARTPLIYKGGWLYKSRWLAAGLFLLVAAVPIAGWFQHYHVSAATAKPLLTQLTDDGRHKGDIRSAGTTIYLSEAEGEHEKLAFLPANGGPTTRIQTPFSDLELQDVSADRQKLLVTSIAGLEAERPLWTIPASGGTPQRVGTLLCGGARWSPDNARIACQSKREILITTPDGSIVRKFGPFPSAPSNLLWSPEGKHLQFVLEAPSTHERTAWEVGLSDRDPSVSDEATKLPIEGNCCLNWTWTQDGKLLVYVQFDAARRPVVVIKPRDREKTGEFSLERQLPLKIRTVAALAPGLTANSVYLLIQGAYRGELLKYDSEHKTFQTIFPGKSGSFLSFSRDGQWMTYTDTVDQTLWRSRADGTDAMQLTRSPMMVQLSSWSPDGQQIAFMGAQPGKPWRIYLINRDGGMPKEVADGTDNQGAPTWSPDGTAIVYGNVSCEDVDMCWIRRIDLANRTVEKLPGSQGLRTARWSPDGKYVAALRPQSHELVLFDFKTQRWTTLAGSISGDNVSWSSDPQFIYVDNPRSSHSAIERIRIRDKHRSTVLDLSSLQSVPGEIGPWFGLWSDNSPILIHFFTGSEVYELSWNEH